MYQQLNCQVLADAYRTIAPAKEIKFSSSPESGSMCQELKQSASHPEKDTKRQCGTL